MWMLSSNTCVSSQSRCAQAPGKDTLAKLSLMLSTSALVDLIWYILFFVFFVVVVFVCVCVCFAVCLVFFFGGGIDLMIVLFVSLLLFFLGFFLISQNGTDTHPYFRTSEFQTPVDISGTSEFTYICSCFMEIRIQNSEFQTPLHVLGTSEVADTCAYFWRWYQELHLSN